jgi:putative ATP-dependent endonuclease of OLD family
MKTLTTGVNQHFPFIGTQKVDDGYLARVLELMLATTNEANQAQRLEASSLGYVNLLHIAVTLAGIPDPSKSPETTSENAHADSSGAADGAVGVNQSPGDINHPAPADNAEDARRKLEMRSEEAEDQLDSFFPQLFHATVLIEEPEAHLHPQLQHGLIRYLRKVTVERPDLQVIVSTHASEIVAACKPDEMVVVRRENGRVVTRTLANIPWKEADRKKITRMTALHLDASRSGALFADRVVLVEGITEAALVRAFGRAWASLDGAKFAFIDGYPSCQSAIRSVNGRSVSWRILGGNLLVKSPCCRILTNATTPCRNQAQRHGKVASLTRLGSKCFGLARPSSQL